MGSGTVSQIQTLTPEQTAEIAMVDLAYMLLVESSEALSFQDMMNRIAAIKNMNQEEIDQMIVQIYTEINLDGRFVNIGNGNWGLKNWYPVEQFDDTVQTVTKSKRKAVVEDDFEDLEEFELDDDFVDEFDEDEVFDEDEEAVDELDEDEEIAEEDDEFIEEDVEIEFENEEESLEELAEEEDIEDEEM